VAGKTTLVAIGKLRGEWKTIYDDYAKRIKPAPVLLDAESPNGLSEKEQNIWENKWLADNIPQKSFIVALDRSGKEVSSDIFAEKLSAWQQQNVCFVVGGSHGLDAAIKKKASALIAFGQATWPHRLCRIMLIEQIYRAQCIALGHPYHK